MHIVSPTPISLIGWLKWFKLYDRTLRICDVFLTLSPSEWLWDELGEYIREVNGWSNDFSLFTTVLIVKDRVSTSKFLDNKFQAMLDSICFKNHPIGEVIHYFWRREYQGRNIQHFRLLLWIKCANYLGIFGRKNF